MIEWQAARCGCPPIPPSAIRVQHKGRPLGPAPNNEICLKPTAPHASHQSPLLGTGQERATLLQSFMTIMTKVALHRFVSVRDDCKLANPWISKGATIHAVFVHADALLMHRQEELHGECKSPQARPCGRDWLAMKPYLRRLTITNASEPRLSRVRVVGSGTCPAHPVGLRPPSARTLTSSTT